MNALDAPPGSGSICGARGEHWGEQGLNRTAKSGVVGLSPPPFCARLLAGGLDNRFCGGNFGAGLMSATPAAVLAANKITMIRSWPPLRADEACSWMVSWSESMRGVCLRTDRGSRPWRAGGLGARSRGRAAHLGATEAPEPGSAGEASQSSCPAAQKVQALLRACSKAKSPSKTCLVTSRFKGCDPVLRH